MRVTTLHAGARGLGTPGQERRYPQGVLRRARPRAVRQARGRHDRHVGGVHQGGDRMLAPGADRLRPLPRAAARAGRGRRGAPRRGARRSLRRGTQAAQGHAVAAAQELLELVAVRLGPLATLQHENKRLYRAYLLKEAMVGVLDCRTDWLAITSRPYASSPSSRSRASSSTRAPRSRRSSVAARSSCRYCPTRWSSRSRASIAP